MSSGLSVGDFATLGHLAWKIYKACKDAPEGFKNISQEVLSLHAVLKELEETHSDANLSAAQRSRLRTIEDGCRAVLEDLQDLVDRYHSLGTRIKRTWDRLAWASENIAELRSRLVSNTVLLTTFVNTAQVIVQKKLDMFLQEFRDGKHEGSIVSTQTVDSLTTDDKQAWRAIRKELEEIGISIAAFDANKDFIVNWFKTAIDTGALEDEIAEEDGSSSILLEDDLSQPFGAPGHDTVLNQPLEDVRHGNTNLTFTSVGLQAARPTPRARIQSPRPSRAATVTTWLFRSNDELFKAVRSQSEAKVRQALEKGARINLKNAKGRTPLFGAVFAGSEAVLRLLLKSGANVNVEDTQGSTPLMFSKTETMMSILLEHGANIQVSNSDGNTALHLAAKSGQETLVQLLLNHGAKIDEKNDNGFTALHQAAKCGHGTIVQLLLNYGAKSNEKNQRGSTALHRAARYGYETAIQLLLNHGANINEKNQHGNTALDSAARHGHEAVVQLLLKYGAKIDVKDDDGHTALHQAAERGPEAVVQLLLDYGANMHEKDKNGNTALHLAARCGREGMCNGTLQITVACLRHLSSHDCASALDSAISEYPNPIGQPYAYAQPVLSLSIDLT